MSKWIDTPQSSNIEGFGYSDTTRALTVKFKTGKVYTFAGVPKRLFTGMKNATSVGSYFQQVIRPDYTGELQNG